MEESRGSGLEDNQVLTFKISHPSEHVSDCSSSSGARGGLVEGELHGAEPGHAGLQQVGGVAPGTVCLLCGWK